MASSCSAKYILQDCSCVTDPLNFYSNVCGYISKNNGLVYQCDPGCCSNMCENRDPDIVRFETRPSAGLALPAGFGVNLPQSEEPTIIPGATPIQQPPEPSYKVWQVALIALIPLLLVLFLSLFLA
jgi:hypothetical protein